MILFRDVTPPGSAVGPRLPSWCDGLRGLQFIPYTEGGTIITLDEPYLVPAPDKCRWKPLTDNWECTIFGKEMEHNRWVRQRSDIVYHPTTDGIGRQWVAPQILTAEGFPALNLSWGKDDSGVRVRKPNEEQARLLAIAEAARNEVMSDKLGQVPIDVLASWAYPLLEACYHLTADVFDALGLVDDKLGVLTVLAAIGFPKVNA